MAARRRTSSSFAPARPTLPARRPAVLAALLALLAAGCDGDPPPLAAPGANIALELDGLPRLDPATEGTYGAWLIDRGGAYHAVGLLAGGDGARATIVSPVARPAAIEVTVEPPGDTDPGPSNQRLLRGVFFGPVARLTVSDALTAADRDLETDPGQFTMMTPSNNIENGVPSNEEAGVWLINVRPRETEQGDQWVRLTPLGEGWVYEGWVVRDHGQADAVWFSYGKFRPDRFGAVNRLDESGAGPFSGVPGFATVRTREFPGDDWLGNPLGLPLPAGITLPLDLRERTATGEDRWTHVITIEPSTDRGEPFGSERPFVLRPYRDPFGQGAAGTARTITFHADALPTGVARALR